MHHSKVPQSVYTFSTDRHLGCFCFLFWITFLRTFVHNCFLCVCVCVCVCVYIYIYILNYLGYIPQSSITGLYGNSVFNIYIFNSLGYIPQSSITGLYGNSVFNILRTCQTVSQSGHTIIWSHLPCLKFPISLHCCQQFLTSIIWTWNNRLVQTGKGVRQGWILSPCLFNF